MEPREDTPCYSHCPPDGSRTLWNLRAKVKRLRNDGPIPTSEDPSDKLETIRQLCATYYLEGYLDVNEVDPIKDNFPLCTMPLASTVPLTVSPAIMRNREYARDYLIH